MLSRLSVGTYQGNELTHNSSRKAGQQSSQLAELVMVIVVLVMVVLVMVMVVLVLVMVVLVMEVVVVAVVVVAFSWRARIPGEGSTSHSPPAHTKSTV